MFEDELDKLLEHHWEDEEVEQIKKVMENLLYYKKLMTKSMKTELTITLNMCNKLKTDLDNLKEHVKMCTCNNNDNITQNTCNNDNITQNENNT